jgi:hypothetical protein
MLKREIDLVNKSNQHRESIMEQHLKHPNQATGAALPHSVCGTTTDTSEAPPMNPYFDSI